MYFDALTLAAVTAELQATILGGRIQRVLLPGPLSVGLEIYAQRQRYYLLAAAHPQCARVHLLRSKPSRGVEQHTPLLLLLRKYVLGGRITALEQPPLERLLVVSIVKEAKSRNSAEASSSASADDAPELLPAEAEQPAETTAEEPANGDEGEADDEQGHAAGDVLRCELIIEPMERRSNIILVDDDNVILESVKRVTARMSQRVILPRQPYEFPPRQDKRDPRTATASGLASLCEQAQPDLVRALVATYRGISPQAAREVVFRVLDQTKVSIINTDNADNADNAGGTDSASRPDLPWEALAAALREICTADWQPTLVPGADDETGGDKPQAYAPYRLTHLRGAEPQPSMSSALEAFYGPREAVTAHQQRRDAVQQQLATARERLAHQLAQIEAELARVENVDRLRWEGEMIFAFMHTLSPGQTVLEVEGEQIALDPERSPVEEAQSRFQAYQKAQSGQERLHERQRETANQLAGIDQLAALLAVADEREQIDLIAQEAAEQGYIAPQKSAKAKAGKGRKGQRPVRRKPLHLVSSDGYDIYVGRSATQNAEVTFRLGRPDDLWLHVRTIPGAHVIVRSGGGEVPERTLREAAGVAAYFSGARGEASVDVELSRRKQVRKIPGAAPGLVSYRAERTLRVAPLLPWGS